MASSRLHLCDICFNQDITEDAIVWCPECEENFCAKCKTYHEIAKASRKHELVSIENVLGLPRFVQQIKLNCTDHDERFLYFCSEHEAPCCIKCIKIKHIDYRKLTQVETIVQNIKQSPTFTDLETTLSDLLTNINNFVEDRKANLQELRKQKRQCEGEIRSARAAIDTYFDELEADINNKMQQAFLKEEMEIEETLEDLNSHKSQVTEMQENLNIVRDIASDFQSFIAMRILSQSALTEDICQQNWLRKKIFNWVDILIVSYNVRLADDKPISLGTIIVKEKCGKVALKMQKSREAQLIRPISISRDIENIQVKLKVELLIHVFSRMCFN